ncbi:HAD family phosphatase [Aquimarina sp. U1-2]|uniref:Cof-type HAD-IIB family hydrolase n=1 Tax=Aquimarina sp. U1-2 TaxID=2823141 RepID=UPI001AEC7C3A|nr:Cof-type HAD-IIB family hydrolase [Aquimarina sp. U1-2]MBP2832242.1 HAD family phosphatase [Aquimarina sp. U1-2]
MQHRIIFSDIDGTLLNPERELSTFTISQIRRIKDSIPMVLISSRMPSAMTHLQEELDITNQPIICYNGALILVDNTPISSTAIPLQVLEALYHFNHDHKVHLSLYNTNDWYVPELDYWAKRESRNTKVNPLVKSTEEVIHEWKEQNKGAHKIMCMGDDRYIDNMYAFLDEKFGDTLHLYRSKSTYIEIAHKSVSKLTAIELLLDTHFNIPITKALAFGDNYNDIEMLKAVGTGVAVANAKIETKLVANAITLSGKEDGVALYIKNNIDLSC